MGATALDGLRAIRRRIDVGSLPHPDPATEAAMGATALDGLRAIRRRIDEPEEYRAADIAADIYTLLGDLGMRV